MGIFSLFGKKDRQAASTSGTAGKDAARARRSGSTGGSRASGVSPARIPVAKRDMQAARDTALKIDAIESEMSSEFVAAPGAVTRPVGAPSAKPSTPVTVAAPHATVPAFANTTEMLLEGQTTISAIAQPSAEAGAAIEEAAILYANGQPQVVEQMLASAIADDELGDAAQRAWLMLFDLYQVLGKQQEFEQLAIEFTNKFETSPPGWTGSDAQEPAPSAGATPTVPFNGKLDASCAKQVERIRNLAANYRALRLEFARINTVDAAGCGLLLDALGALQKSGHEVVLVGAAELAGKIREIIALGRREDGEQPWLLLLEILRLLNREREFEEVSMDYCVTFEVSPPAFVAPQGSVTTALAEAQPDEPDAFVMPRLIEGRIDDLILAIARWADEHQPAIIDCSRLQKIDFNAAGRLLTGLSPFCGNGKTLEFHHVNQLVAELFQVIGLQEIARVVVRK